jgi:hypothetical protein
MLNWIIGVSGNLAASGIIGAWVVGRVKLHLKKHRDVMRLEFNRLHKHISTGKSPLEKVANE